MRKIIDGTAKSVFTRAFSNSSQVGTPASQEALANYLKGKGVEEKQMALNLLEIGEFMSRMTLTSLNDGIHDGSRAPIVGRYHRAFLDSWKEFIETNPTPNSSCCDGAVQIYCKENEGDVNGVSIFAACGKLVLAKMFISQGKSGDKNRLMIIEANPELMEELEVKDMGVGGRVVIAQMIKSFVDDMGRSEEEKAALLSQSMPVSCTLGTIGKRNLRYLAGQENESVLFERRPAQFIFRDDEFSFRGFSVGDLYRLSQDVLAEKSHAEEIPISRTVLTTFDNSKFEVTAEEVEARRRDREIARRMDDPSYTVRNPTSDFVLSEILPNNKGQNWR